MLVKVVYLCGKFVVVSKQGNGNMFFYDSHCIIICIH